MLSNGTPRWTGVLTLALRVIARQARRYWLWVLVVALGIAVLFIYLILPPLLVPPDLQISLSDRLRAQNDVRASALQLLGGVAVAIGLYFTAQTYRLSVEGHVTDRFRQTIELLTSTGDDVRVGAIRSLERLAEDSPRDQQRVIDVLAAYIRQHSSWDPTQRLPDVSDPKTESTRDLLERLWGNPRVLSDVQIAATALINLRTRALRRSSQSRASLDLSNTDLRGLDATGAQLSGVILSRSCLDGANLESADMTHSDLTGSSLRDANLIGANLDEAIFHGSDTKTGGADFQGANYSDATVWPKYRTTSLPDDAAARLGIQPERRIAPGTCCQVHRQWSRSMAPCAS